MIKHKYCYMPILNFVQCEFKEKYIDFTDENIFNKFSNIKEVFSDKNCPKLKYNPKRFSFDEIMLFENMKYIVGVPLKFENKNEQEINLNEELFDDVFDFAINDYINLNYAQYAQNKEKEIRQNNAEEYLKGLKIKFLELENKVKGQENNDSQKENQKNENCQKQEYFMKFNSSENNNIDLSKFVIGLYNTKITDKSITDNLIKPQVPTFDDVQKLIKFLNLAIEDKKIKCNMIVFPEVCIPYQTLGLFADFSKKHNVAIVCGLKHITVNNTVLNLIATVLPFNIGNYNNSYINFRLKEWYSPSEIKEIKKYGKTIPYNHMTKEKANSNNLFVWNGLHFAVYDCFELADTNYRCEYKSFVDMIIACEWNKDLDYFNNIIKSAARDIHCYVTQVNTSQFGDSKVIAPKKSSEMTLLNIKGGEDNILIGKLNIEELREFQRKETEYLEEKDKIFKPLPPAFKKETSRLTKNKN